MMKKGLIILALAVAASARTSSAFAPGAAVRSATGDIQAVRVTNNRFAPSSHVKPSTALALSTAGGASKVAAAEPPKNSALFEALQTGSYFALWYLFNIAYNIYNKQSLNALAYPWTIATIQMAAGIAYFFTGLDARTS